MEIPRTRMLPVRQATTKPQRHTGTFKLMKTTCFQTQWKNNANRSPSSSHMSTAMTKQSVRPLSSSTACWWSGTFPYQPGSQRPPPVALRPSRLRTLGKRTPLCPLGPVHATGSNQDPSGDGKWRGPGQTIRVNNHNDNHLRL